MLTLETLSIRHHPAGNCGVSGSELTERTTPARSSARCRDPILTEQSVPAWDFTVGQLVRKHSLPLEKSGW
jgi:hypothetical protein